jgi:hypothetical protein
MGPTRSAYVISAWGTAAWESVCMHCGLAWHKAVHASGTAASMQAGTRCEWPPMQELWHEGLYQPRCWFSGMPAGGPSVRISMLVVLLCRVTGTACLIHAKLSLRAQILPADGAARAAVAHAAADAQQGQFRHQPQVRPWPQGLPVCAGSVSHTRARHAGSGPFQLEKGHRGSVSSTWSAC